MSLLFYLPLCLTFYIANLYCLYISGVVCLSLNVGMYLYLYSDALNVLSGLQNTTYWIVVNKTLNETA